MTVGGMTRAAARRRWRAVLATVALSCVGVLAWQQCRLRALTRLAMSDPLTGLLNRRGWERAVRLVGNRDALVCVVDLTGLKRANERGHAAGDMLIRSGARCLAGVARHGDSVARLGGDEFGLVACSPADRNPEAFAARVRAAFARDGISAVVGAASSASEGSIDAAVRAADRALTAARRTGREDG